MITKEYVFKVQFKDQKEFEDFQTYINEAVRVFVEDRRERKQFEEEAKSIGKYIQDMIESGTLDAPVFVQDLNDVGVLDSMDVKKIYDSHYSPKYIGKKVAKKILNKETSIDSVKQLLID